MDRIYHEAEYEVVEKPGMFRTWKTAAGAVAWIIFAAAACWGFMVGAAYLISHHTIGTLQWFVAGVFACVAAVCWRAARNPRVSEDRVTVGIYWFVFVAAVLAAVFSSGVLR